MDRIRLTADLGLYVAAAGGDDANDGTDPASPLATINEAVRRVCDGYDPNGHQMNINLLADATNKHRAVELLNYMDAGVIAQQTNARILGDPAHPELHQIEGGQFDPGAVWAVDVKATWLLEGVKLTHPSGKYGILADHFSTVYTRSVAFGDCGVHACAVFNSSIEFLTNGAFPLYTVTGAAASSLMANQRGTIILQGGGGPVVFRGVPSLTDSFANLRCQSLLYFGATYTGALLNNKSYTCEWLSGIQGAPALPPGNLPSVPLYGSYAN